jgi:hypothetical protein
MIWTRKSQRCKHIFPITVSKALAIPVSSEQHRIKDKTEPGGHENIPLSNSGYLLVCPAHTTPFRVCATAHTLLAQEDILDALGFKENENTKTISRMDFRLYTSQARHMQPLTWGALLVPPPPHHWPRERLWELWLVAPRGHWSRAPVTSLLPCQFPATPVPSTAFDVVTEWPWGQIQLTNTIEPDLCKIVVLVLICLEENFFLFL